MSSLSKFVFKKLPLSMPGPNPIENFRARSQQFLRIHGRKWKWRLPTNETKIIECSNRWRDGRSIMWKNLASEKPLRSAIRTNRQLLAEFLRGGFFKGAFWSRRRRTRKSSSLLRNHPVQNWTPRKISASSENHGLTKSRSANVYFNSANYSQKKPTGGINMDLMPNIESTILDWMQIWPNKKLPGLVLFVQLLLKCHQFLVSLSDRPAEGN
jgi:hypothetical protein